MALQGLSKKLRPHNGVARTLKKLLTSKGDYWINQKFSSIVSLYKRGTSLKGKNLLPEGVNSFLYEQFLIVWKITFITLSDLPRMLLFLLHTCVTCVMGATPMPHLCAANCDSGSKTHFKREAILSN